MQLSSQWCWLQALCVCGLGVFRILHPQALLCAQLLTSILSLRCPWHSVLQGRGPLPGPKRGLLSNSQKWIVRGDTDADKARLLGRGAQVESIRVRDLGRLLCHVARSLRFYGGGISFWVVFGQSGSFPVANSLPSQGWCQWKWFWAVVGHISFRPFPL